jgi:excisionase family DNA binding protein
MTSSLDPEPGRCPNCIKVYTYQEAAQLLGLSTRTLEKAVAEFEIPHYRFGRLVKFSAQHLKSYLNIHEQLFVTRRVRKERAT